MSLKEKNYQLDRTAFNAMTFEESADHYNAWKNKSYTERLQAAFFLINQFYKTSNTTPINKSLFSKRKHA